jgi:hypothetical protein
MARKTQRNDPCPCGSGKKYKKCCIGKDLVNSKDSQAKIMQIKVSLVDVDPPVWRRLIVPGDISLGDFHYVLQSAMGWGNEHLHEFIYKDKHYGPPDSESFHPIYDEDAFRLDSIMRQKGSVLAYLYDFGDSWMHRVELENNLDPEPGADYPRCLEGQRACPPEDCGGAPGYREILMAIAKPKLKKHKELIEWVGEDFDPGHFDSHEVNELFAHEAQMNSEYEEYNSPIDYDENDTEDDWEDFSEEVYDADTGPDPEAWLALEEDERHIWTQAYHELKKPHDRPENPKIHAIMHSVAETWLASGDPPEARIALERLTSEGLSRHEAIHAIASALAGQIWEILQGRKPDNKAMAKKLAGMSRRSWEKHIAE